MTAPDISGGVFDNSGIITSGGCVGIGGNPSQYPVSGEPIAGLNVISKPGDTRYAAITSYGSACAPFHFLTAGGTLSSPTAPIANTTIADLAARCWFNGSYGGSSFAFQVHTTEDVGAVYSGCRADLQLTPNGGSRQVVTNWYGNGDQINPVSGGRLIIGASSLSGMSNHSGILAPLTPDVGNILWAVGKDTSHVSHYVGCVSGTGFNYANSANYFGKDVTTGRSLNAGGTVNASGADYAEYETKASGCGDFAKGDIAGFDTRGLLTDKWADAVSFGVKSTNPALVGGDSWGAESVKDAAALRASVDRIAYCGKVPVNVWHARPGDYIIPAKRGPGITGVAVRWKLWRKPVGRVRRILPDGRAEITVMS